jgi:hypothetical protein
VSVVLHVRRRWLFKMRLTPDVSKWGRRHRSTSAASTQGWIEPTLTDLDSFTSAYNYIYMFNTTMSFSSDAPLSNSYIMTTKSSRNASYATAFYYTACSMTDPSLVVATIMLLMLRSLWRVMWALLPLLRRRILI